MNIIRFKNNWAWVYLLIIVCLTFTVIPGWLPFVRKEWVLLVLGTLMVANITHHFLGSKSAICLYLYFIILYLNKIAGDVAYNSLPNIIYEVLQYLVPSAICLYMFKNKDVVFARWVVVSVFAVVCVESVASFFINETFPNIIRNLEGLTRAEGDRSFKYQYYKMGLADYSFCHALPIMIPPLICWIKDKKTKWKWIIWCILMLTCLLIYISASGTAILLMVLMLTLGFLTGVSNKSKNIGRLIASLIVFSPFLFSEQMQLATIDTVSSALPSDAFMTRKLESIHYSIEQGSSEGDVEARVIRYDKSVDGFIENPFWGSNRKLGGHSSFLDRLGNLGLVGITPLLLFLIIQYKLTQRYIPDKHSLFYLEGMIAAMLIFLLKAVSLLPVLIITFVVLPFMFVTNYNRK